MKQNLEEEEENIYDHQLSFRNRLKICLTLPHGAALLSLIFLFCHVVWIIRLDTITQAESEAFARRCAFVYNAPNNQVNFSRFRKSLTSLNTHFNYHLPYHVIILHHSIPPVTRGHLQASSERLVSFRHLKQQQRQPQFYTIGNTSTLVVTDRLSRKLKKNEMSPVKSKSNIGINNWSLTQFIQLCKGRILSDIDYIVQLKTDGIFKSQVKKDFIQTFARDQFQYAYQTTSNECSANKVNNISQLTHSYVELNGIIPRNSHLWLQFSKAAHHNCIPKFTGHFQVINLRFLRSHTGIQDWIRVVEKNHLLFPSPDDLGILHFITMALYSVTDKVAKYDFNVVPFHKNS